MLHIIGDTKARIKKNFKKNMKIAKIQKAWKNYKIFKYIILVMDPNVMNVYRNWVFRRIMNNSIKKKRKVTRKIIM